MKKLTSVLLCMVLVLSMLCVNVAAAETACMEAGVTVSEDGTVTVAVRAKQPAANARLTVDFDSDYLTYVGCETGFAVHSVKAEEEKLTVGLASASANAVKAGETLAQLRFAVTGRWDETAITLTAVNFAGKAVNESMTLSVPGSGYRFRDVKAEDWFFEAVDHLAAEGCIAGITENSFGPALDMTRASFLTLLGRLAGVELTHAETRFTDVPVDSFYSGYVAWAVEKGITGGVDATHFAPAAPVNRAQMVCFLYAYAKSEGMDVEVSDPAAALAQFSDADTLPAWAVAPMAWAVENGIISGMDGKLVPAGIANRAQAAVVLYQFFVK